MAATGSSFLSENVQQRAFTGPVWPFYDGYLARLEFGVNAGESACQAVELSNRLSTNCVEVDAHAARIAGLAAGAEQEVRRDRR